mgnify:FL=1
MMDGLMDGWMGHYMYRYRNIEMFLQAKTWMQRKRWKIDQVSCVQTDRRGEVAREGAEMYYEIHMSIFSCPLTLTKWLGWPLLLSYRLLLLATIAFFRNSDGLRGSSPPYPWFSFRPSLCIVSHNEKVRRLYTRYLSSYLTLIIIITEFMLESIAKSGDIMNTESESLSSRMQELVHFINVWKSFQKCAFSTLNFFRLYEIMNGP